MDDENKTDETTEVGFWGILELMGHVKIAGYVTEEERFGSKVGRIDIPMPDGTAVTQFFGGSAIYRLTPATEAVARRYAVVNAPRPVSVYDLRLPEQATRPAVPDTFLKREPGHIFFEPGSEPPKRDDLEEDGDWRDERFGSVVDLDDDDDDLEDRDDWEYERYDPEENDDVRYDPDADELPF